MLKELNILTLCFLFSFYACGDTINFDHEKITEVIQKIEYSINKNNISVYKKNSDAQTFYNFNSTLCKYVKSKNNRPVFTIEPSAFSSTNENIKVEVLLSYSINLKIKSINIDIPQALMQKLISYGLPDKAYFYFSQRKNQYFLTDVDYPIRYKYMELLK